MENKDREKRDAEIDHCDYCGDNANNGIRVENLFITDASGRIVNCECRLAWVL